jgi:YtxH-like protein
MSSYPMTERDLTSTGLSGTSVVLAFLAGAAVGAVAALLTTPKSGPEMRATIRDWAKSFNDGEGTRAMSQGLEHEHTRPMGTYDRPAGT